MEAQQLLSLKSTTNIVDVQLEIKALQESLEKLQESKEKLMTMENERAQKALEETKQTEEIICSELQKLELILLDSKVDQFNQQETDSVSSHQVKVESQQTCNEDELSSQSLSLEDEFKALSLRQRDALEITDRGMKREELHKLEVEHEALRTKWREAKQRGNLFVFN